MLTAEVNCDGCIAPSLRRRAHVSTAIAFSSLPFLITFFFVATVVSQRLLPLLSNLSSSKEAPKNSSASSPSIRRKVSITTVSAWAFSATIALATVLVELILCEISNTIDPAAREAALNLTVSILLFLLIITIPFLEIRSIISAAGWDFTGKGKGRLRLAWVLQMVGFVLWILGFWWSGQSMLGRRAAEHKIDDHRSLREACLERVGIIGIFLMSLLSGFASVSSPWQSFGARSKPVTEDDVARKAAGLEATNEMLSAKRSRLRALERKISETPTEGFFQKAIGTIRGNADQTERSSLQLEISGLETMSMSLSTSLSMLRNRLHQQNRSQSPLGRICQFAGCAFSIFCLYRIGATTITAIRRLLSSSDTFRGSDPINNTLALLAKHYDPHLDQAAWAQQISFLFSGIILFASFSSVMQTFHFFARFMPSLLKAVQANLALVVAQVCGTYVISAALMLKGMMPGQVVGQGLDGLGGKDMSWVDGWFEFWFLIGVGVTALGIWVGKKITGGDDWDDDGDVEMGKRS